MPATVSSMEFKGVYRDLGLMLNLAKLKAELTKLKGYTKSTGAEFLRMTNTTKLLGAAMGLIGAFGFAKLLMQAPRTAAALSLVWTYLELIANIMDKYVSPAVRWLASGIKWLYEKFKELDPALQGAVTWLLILGFAAGGIVSAALTLGITWASVSSVLSWAVGVIGAVVAALTGPVGLAVALGIVLLILGYLALDKLGVIDWLDDLWVELDKLVYRGDALAAVFNLTTIPLRLLIDLIGILVGDKSWNDLLADLGSMEASLLVIWNTMKKIANMGFEALGINYKFGMSEITDRSYLRNEESTPAKTETVKKETVITGNTFTLPNVTNAEELMEELERMQAEAAAWEGGI